MRLAEVNTGEAGRSIKTITLFNLRLLRTNSVVNNFMVIQVSRELLNMDL